LGAESQSAWWSPYESDQIGIAVGDGYVEKKGKRRFAARHIEELIEILNRKITDYET
jgi:hypothetical protein